jgi:hypothetical protein
MNKSIERFVCILFQFERGKIAHIQIPSVTLLFVPLDRRSLEAVSCPQDTLRAEKSWVENCRIALKEVSEKYRNMDPEVFNGVACIECLFIGYTIRYSIQCLVGKLNWKDLTWKYHIFPFCKLNSSKPVSSCCPQASRDSKVFFPRYLRTHMKSMNRLRQTNVCSRSK